MKKRYLLNSLSILSIFALLPVSASSADENQMQITASRQSMAVNDTLNEVLIIDRQQIDASSAVTLFELLRGYAGIDLVRKGGLGQEFSLFVRGANSNQLLVLIDGVEVGSATLGLKALADISLSQIQRIELVKGPRASLWGSRALGGVLQIFSRQTEGVSLSATLGSQQLRGASLAGMFEQDGFSLGANYERLESDGLDSRLDLDPDQDGFERENLMLKAGWQIDNDQSVRFDWLQQQGLTEFDTGWGGDELVFDNQVIRLGYDYQQEQLSHSVLVSNQTDRSTTQGAGSMPLRFETDNQLFRYEVSMAATNDWQVGASLNWQEDDIGDSDSSYVVSARESISSHLFSHYKTQNWLAEVAVQYTDIDGLPTNVSSHLGLGYRPISDSLLSLNWGEGFKAPTFNDLYFPYGGNPDLAHELADNLELRYQQWQDWGNWQISLYQNDISNLIQWLPDSQGIWSPQNVGLARLEGIDAGIDWQTGAMNHQLQLSWLDAVDQRSLQPLALRASKQFSYRLAGHWLESQKLSYQLSIHYVGERPDMDYQTFMPTRLSDYSQVDLTLNYPISDALAVDLRLDDLFNEQGINVSGYRPQGRTFRLQLRYQPL